MYGGEIEFLYRFEKASLREGNYTNRNFSIISSEPTIIMFYIYYTLRYLKEIIVYTH